MSNWTKAWTTAVSTLVLAALVVGTCAAMFPGVANAQAGVMEVRMARLAPSSLLWLHAIANDQGFYERHGVRVTDVQVQSSAALVQAVASGSADAGIALGDNVMQAVDQGASVVITGAILQQAGAAFHRHRGFGARTGGQAGDSRCHSRRHHRLDAVHVHAGRHRPACHARRGFDQLVGPSRGAPKGHLDGALLIPPFDTLALRNGAKLLDVYDGYWLQTPLIVNKDWAARNPEAARRVDAGIGRGGGAGFTTLPTRKRPSTFWPDTRTCRTTLWPKVTHSWWRKFRLSALICPCRRKAWRAFSHSAGAVRR